MVTYDVDQLRQFESEADVNMVACIDDGSDDFVVATLSQFFFVKFLRLVDTRHRVQVQRHDTQRQATFCRHRVFRHHHTPATNIISN